MTPWLDGSLTGTRSVFDKEPSPWGDARGVGQCSGMSLERYGRAVSREQAQSIYLVR